MNETRIFIDNWNSITIICTILDTKIKLNCLFVLLLNASKQILFKSVAQLVFTVPRQ